ncbi:MAG: penicillin-binding protein 2 [Patescibacteria group bacterium]
MKFFRQRSKTRPYLFVHGDDSVIATVEGRAKDVAFDQWVAESEQARSDASAHFLGVSLRSSRLKLSFIVLFGLLALFVGKAAYLQIVGGAEFRALAEGNRERIDFVPALRGVIYDRNLEVLAENAPTFRLTAVPNDLPDDEELGQLWSQLADLTGVSVAEILSRAAEGIERPNEPVVIINRLSYEIAITLMLRRADFPGLVVESSTERQYVTDRLETLAHILGYTGRINEAEYEALHQSGYRLIDEVGKAGVEKTYETELRGTYGRQVNEVDALGREINIVSKEDAVNGVNLMLSIDAALTAKIEQVLEERIGIASRAAVVVEDPTNGELLALVSTPSFDANDFAGGIDAATYQSLLDDPNNPLFDRSIGGAVPSGSTFKPIVAAAALQEGLIDVNTSFLSVGGLQVGPYFFKDWKAGGHGVANVTSALAESINTFFYYIGGGYGDFTGLGVERLNAYAARFGLGQQLGIDLPGEAGGLLPTKQWKEETKGERWYVGDTFNLSIGQGDLLVTPLQIAMMTSVFANGGKLYQPRVARAFLTDGGERLIEPHVLNQQVVDQNVIDVVRQGLRQAVLTGSSRSLQSLPVTSAGKTGTAQWSNTHPTHAWFTGFAPYEDPQVVITVFVEEGGGGDVTAVPIAREILQWWFSQYQVEAALPTVDTELDADGTTE